jgi:group I intron endonuclease
MRFSGIYIILNTVTKDCYIGSAVNFRKRWNNHKSDLVKNKHHSKIMQNSYNKHGNVFEYSILLFCSKEDLIFMNSG